MKELSILLLLSLFISCSSTDVESNLSPISCEDAKTESIVIFLDKRGSIFLNGEPISNFDSLTERLNSTSHEGKTFTVCAANNMSLNKLMHLIDVVKMAGVENLSLVSPE